MLSREQIDQFKTHGFVLLRNFVDESTINIWQDQFWHHLGADADNPGTWPDDYVIQDLAMDPLFGQLPQMTAIVEQLGGGMFDGGGGSMLVKWPDQKKKWGAPDEGHIDGYGPNGWSGGFMFGATTYINDVKEHGGGFFFWPDSHLPVQDYFRAHPKQIDGSFRDRDDWDEFGWRLFSNRSPAAPQEFTGNAGDVILWHCFLCHTGSNNTRSQPRLGVFSRWHRSDREEMKFDVPENLWKYWAI